MRIRNNSKGALEVCGVLIQPGAEEPVPGYVETPLVRAWIRARVLSVVEEPAVVAEPGPADASERAALFDVLASYGLRPGGRTSNERLLAMVVDVKAAQANAEAGNSYLTDPEPAAQPEE